MKLGTFGLSFNVCASTTWTGFCSSIEDVNQSIDTTSAVSIHSLASSLPFFVFFSLLDIASRTSSLYSNSVTMWVIVASDLYKNNNNNITKNKFLKHSKQQNQSAEYKP